MFLLSDDIRIPTAKLEKLLHDPEKTAAAAHLVYVSDTQPGIRRIRHGTAFAYQLNGKTVRDKKTLARIRSLVIPPAWENVWICLHDNGHLQATGLDARHRKQYRYHPLWSSLRNHTKYYRLQQFGHCIPAMRARLQHDLALPGLPLPKVLAAIVSLMEHTSIRIGNNAYEKQNGSFGLTTLKDRHVQIEGPVMKFMFRGKKGIGQNISLRSRKLANIVKKCRDIPGKELFQYIDGEGQRHSIDSGMVNAYIREISGEDFTAKDFRTWAGSAHALAALREAGEATGATDAKRKINAALDRVSAQLGNTRSVCRKYYVHPVLIDLYEQQQLQAYFAKAPVPGDGANDAFSADERLLLHILEQHVEPKAGKS